MEDGFVDYPCTFFLPPARIEEEHHPEVQYMVTKAEGWSAILMSLPKPLKETEFDIKNRAELFRHRTRADFFDMSPIEHCEPACLEYRSGIEKGNEARPPRE